MEKIRKGFNTMRTEGKGVRVNCTRSCDICGLESDCNVHLHTVKAVTSL
jgi:hypothetical protein